MFPKLLRTTSVSDKLPLVAMTAEGRTLTKGGDAAMVIRVRGRDYGGLAPSVVAGLFEGRKLFFDSLPPELTCMVQSHRRRVELGKNNGLVPQNYYARKIAEIAAQNFKVSFRTNHNIIFTTSTENVFSQIGHLVGEKKHDFSTEKLRIMDDAVASSLERFKNYDAWLLTGEDLASYWATLVNGREVRQVAPNNGIFDNDLSGTQLFWPRKENFQIYRGVNDIYSGFLTIKAPPSKTSGALLNELFQAPVEFSIYQSFTPFDKVIAQRAVEDRLKAARTWAKYSDIKDMELQELSNCLESDEISLLRHRWCVEVFGASPKDLEKNIGRFAATIERHGIRVARETVGREGLFWGRFPDYERLNPRIRNITSSNASHSATFPVVGEGKEECSWGKAPHCYHMTTGGSQYGLTVHEHTRANALGNMCVFGGSESGKTTFVSHLFSQCTKYPGWHGVCFDRHFGLEVFTEMMDGKYISAKDLNKLELNPVQLSDTPENRIYVVDFVKMLTRMDDTRSNTIISEAVSQFFQLDFQDRTLTELANALGLPDQDTPREAIEAWLPGGSLGGIFNHPRNALNFDKQIVTFDMTSILDSPVLGPFLSVIFHFLFIRSFRV